MQKITLVNPNLVFTPVAPYALDILATGLTQWGFEVDILDLTLHKENWAQAIHSYFQKSNPDYIGISFRNWFDVSLPSLYNHPHHGSFLPTIEQIVDQLSTFIKREKIIAGGIGFSLIPQTILERNKLKYGVIGAGETVFPQLIKQLSHVQPVHDIPYVIEDGKDFKPGPTESLKIPINRRDFVNNRWYYQEGETVGMRATNGCDKKCLYCPEYFAKGNLHRNSIDNVLQEIDQLVDQGITNIHLTDSEANIPFNYFKELAKNIINKGYPQELSFWSYMQILPFDEEFARLWKKAGMKGIAFGTDHVDQDILHRFNKWYTLADIEKTTKICNDNGIAVMHELLFGYYGETPDSIKRAIDSIWKFQPHMIGTTLGLGIYPGTLLAQDPRIQAALKESDENTRMTEYGVYCKGVPLADPTFLVSPDIKVPEIYKQVRQFVGTRINRIMITTIAGNSKHDNNLVNSEKGKYMRTSKKKGAIWFYHPDQFIQGVHRSL